MTAAVQPEAHPWQEVDRLAHGLVDLPERELSAGEKLSRYRAVLAARRYRDALIAVEELPDLKARYEAAKAEAAVFFPDEIGA